MITRNIREDKPSVQYTVMGMNSLLIFFNNRLSFAFILNITHISQSKSYTGSVSYALYDSFARWLHSFNKSTLGRVLNTPWPASISKQEQQWMPFPGILGWNGQRILKVKVNDPIFNTNQENVCIFGANLIIVAQIHYKLLCGEANSLEFSTKMAKMTLKVKVNDLYFNSSQGYTRMHVWCNLVIVA